MTPLEHAVLERLLSGPGPPLAALRAQLEVASVRSRGSTGAGFFTRLQVPRETPPADVANGPLEVPDCIAEIEGLEHGAGFVLWIESGRLGMLEGYSFDEPWPAEVERFTLR